MQQISDPRTTLAEKKGKIGERKQEEQDIMPSIFLFLWTDAEIQNPTTIYFYKFNIQHFTTLGYPLLKEKKEREKEIR